MFRKIAGNCVYILLAVSLTGCSLFVPYRQTISISGHPANATVTVNGQQMTTPANIKVRRNKSVNIVVSKPGYNSFVSNSGYTLSSWGVLDIVGGVFFLVPFVGLIAPGAYELSQDHFNYVLTPVNP